MPPKKDKKKKVKKPAKKSAVSQSQNITVNISKGTRVPKKAPVVQNIPIRTPSIFNPAPTPFQISAPQPAPFSSKRKISMYPIIMHQPLPQQFGEHNRRYGCEFLQDNFRNPYTTPLLGGFPLR